KGEGHKSCIWTAFDNELYNTSFNRDEITPELLKQTVLDILNGKEISNHKLMIKIVLASKNGLDAVFNNQELMDKLADEIELSKRGLPSTISATFKSCFRKYAAVVENLGMYIAKELDMPTSYNYIVAFDKDEYPIIIDNYHNSSRVDKLQPVGIVSVDFLQNKEVPEYEEDYRVKTEDGYEWTTISKNYSGDKLVAFYDTLNTSVKDNLNGDANLIKNWIRGVNRVAETYMTNFTKEEKSLCLDNTYSRIVRSTLLREFLGDCDFTAYNGGIVVNPKKHTFRYAPNFDFGESFNGLVKENLDVESNTLSEDILNSLPEDVRQKLLQSQQGKSKKTIEEIACSFASSTGETNFKFIMENYSQYAKEFFDNLQDAISRNAFDKLVDKYTQMSINGEPLLTLEEAEKFKQYIKIRAGWMISMHNNFIKNNQERTL
ncbi:MAG: hypothetical protein ACI4PF_05655, partial [Christensenellales bacterium]